MEARRKVAYVQFSRDNIPVDADAMNAYQGLDLLGYRVYPYTYPAILSGNFAGVYKTSVFVGETRSLTSIFARADVTPPPFDYPAELMREEFMGRQLAEMRTDEAVDRWTKERMPFFIKSVRPKLYSGILIKADRQLAYLDQYLCEPAWVSTPLQFKSEWRCFVHQGKLVDSRPYQGDFRLAPDYTKVDSMIAEFKSAPVAYTLDVGIDQLNRTLVVEVNDFWAIGAYGLSPEVYAQMLIDRYEQIVG